MVFEKVFPEAVDPGDVVAQLELGETLSTYDENTRDFMFPGPNQISGHHDSNRQVTMRRISGLRDKFTYHSAPVEKSHGRPQCRTSRSQKKKSKSPERSKYCVNTKSYEQPTISSKSHSPSPYTKRRMCELSEDTRRRLAHLNLGPYEFKKETDKPPFVIRHSLMLTEIKLHYDAFLRLQSSCLLSPDTAGSALTVQLNVVDIDIDAKMPTLIPQVPGLILYLDHLVETVKEMDGPGCTVIIITLAAADPRIIRFHSDWCSPPNCDEIHDRVKDVLKSHQAHARHICVSF
ncbi:hypothetical protein U0070_008830 [Myodes glareolus]|uniref:Spermatogenesis-associated protein 6 N-terminal domain-containing protein n=1 Tax=Myodes glareolus TaxID=447135 RepID=A0AAW0IJA3_MYOGA